MGRTRSTEYDLAGDVIATVDGRGIPTRTWYDAARRPVLTLDGRSNPTRTWYDPLGAAAETVDAVGNPGYSFRDALGRLTGTRDANGFTTQDFYNLVGDLTQSVDERGKSTTFAFDLLDRRVATTDPNSNRWRSILDAVGNTVQTIDANNKSSYATFDGDNRTTRTKDADGFVGSETFDPAGNVTSTTDANGVTSFAWFDADNRQVLAQDPNLHFNQTVFNNLGEVIATVDGAGDTTQDAYDGDEEETGQRDANGNLTQTGFNADGQVTAVTDPDTNTTSTAYDRAGNQIVSTDPLGRVTVTTFDADNRVSSVTDRLGRKRLYAYDPDGRLLSETWKNADGSTADTRSYTYDQAGNVLTAGNGFGSYTYTYDNAGRTLTQTDPFGKVLTYGYDGDNRVTSVTDNLGGVVSSVYDPAGRLTTRQLTVSSQAQASVGFTYTPRGQLATAQRSANTGGTLQVVGQSVYNYDTAGNVQRIRHQNAAGTTNLLDLNSTYDNADRLTSETDNGTTTTYSYDNASQVTQAGSTGYSYDANGNRNNSGFVTGPDNLLQTATIGGVTWNYTYDLENNRIKATQGSSAPTWTYTYNLANQMTSAEERATDGGTVLIHVNFAYDVNRQLVQTAVTVGTGGVTDYARDRGQVWADLDGSAGNALKVRYLSGDGTNEWLARLVSAGYANAGLSFYLTDRKGSVRGLTDNTGVLQDQLSYDAFGNVSESNAPYGDNRKYAGYQFEATVGLYYALARWYDSGTGQWTTEDPSGLGPGPNPRAYVGNDPTNATDPSGLQEPPVKLEKPIRQDISEFLQATNQFAKYVKGRAEGRPEMELYLEATGQADAIKANGAAIRLKPVGTPYMGSKIPAPPVELLDNTFSPLRRPASEPPRTKAVIVLTDGAAPWTDAPGLRPLELLDPEKAKQLRLDLTVIDARGNNSLIYNLTQDALTNLGKKLKEHQDAGTLDRLKSNDLIKLLENSGITAIRNTGKLLTPTAVAQALRGNGFPRDQAAGNIVEADPQNVRLFNSRGLQISPDLKLKDITNLRSDNVSVLGGKLTYDAQIQLKNTSIEFKPYLMYDYRADDPRHNYFEAGFNAIIIFGKRN
jgi:RHS repeat-associated protein